MSSSQNLTCGLSTAQESHMCQRTACLRGAIQNARHQTMYRKMRGEKITIKYNKGSRKKGKKSGNTQSDCEMQVQQAIPALQARFQKSKGKRSCRTSPFKKTEVQSRRQMRRITANHCCPAEGEKERKAVRFREGNFTSSTTGRKLGAARGGSVYMDDWPKVYCTSAMFANLWKKCQENASDAKWPDGAQLPANKTQFLYLDGELCVPESLQTKVIEQWQQSVTGHCGVRKLKEGLKRGFKVAQLDNIVRSVRRKFATCQMCDRPNFNGPGQRQSTPIQAKPMDSIPMDILSMPHEKTWDGKPVDACFVVVDRHSG